MPLTPSQFGTAGNPPDTLDEIVPVNSPQGSGGRSATVNKTGQAVLGAQQRIVALEGRMPIITVTAGNAVTGITTTQMTVATATIGSVARARLVRVTFVCSVTATVATDTWQLALVASSTAMTTIALIYPGSMSAFGSASYVLPANTAETLTLNLVRRTGTGTVASGGGDARYHAITTEVTG